MPTATEASNKASARKSTGRTRKGASKKKTPMTDEHKTSLREGREQARAINRYLEALDAYRPTRGRKVTKESRQRRLDEIGAELASATGLARVNLIAERDAVRAWLAKADGNSTVDLPKLEAEFVKHAASYSERKNIPRSAWREAGVQADVLDAAGIGRS